MKVLMIEDDADIRESVRILLEGEGFLVEEADCGERGLELLEEDTELVILDVVLPDMTGFQICQKIRKHSLVPILFLTARTGESDKLLGFGAGGDDYLVKPFSYAELLARIKALVRRRKEYDRMEGEGARKKPSEDYIERGSCGFIVKKMKFISERDRSF